MNRLIGGFSLVQLLLVLIVIVILAGHSMGSYTTQLQTAHLKGALQSIYFEFQQARRHSVAQRQSVLVDVHNGTQWCIGFTDKSDCDCQIEASCTVMGIEKVLSHQQFPFSRISASTFAHDNQSRFSTPRGFAEGYAGSLTLSGTQQAFKVIISNLGRARICTLSPPAEPYKPC